MTLIEIENLPASELKSQYAELVEAAKSGDPAELAERFVAARLDAKFRDEKLGEQGRTINALNDALETKTSQLSVVTSERDGLLQLVKQKCEAVDAAQAQIAELQQKLAAESSRADRLKAEATRHFTALSAAQKALADAMNAQELDAADRG